MDTAPEIRYLIDAARCIKKVLGNVGDVYRIGGDEFVVIIEGKDVDGQAYQAKLTEEIEKAITRQSIPLRWLLASRQRKLRAAMI